MDNVDAALAFIGACNEALDKVEKTSDHVFYFTCPLCNGKARALWRDDYGRMEPAAGSCEGCGMRFVV